MQNATKDQLRQNAKSLIENATNVEAARKEFLTACETRFTKNSDGLTHDQYIAAATDIWDDVKLQHNARHPGQSDQASKGQRT